MNVEERFERCVVAATPAMGRAAAEIVCDQAVYASRGLRSTRRNRASGTRAKSGARGSPRVSSGASRRTRSARGRYSTGTGR